MNIEEIRWKQNNEIISDVDGTFLHTLKSIQYQNLCSFYCKMSDKLAFIDDSKFYQKIKIVNNLCKV